MLEQQGVPADKIWTEEQSRSTYENALYSARLLKEHGIRQIAVIVEADSMPRADAAGAVWVRPELVGEVKYGEWTPDRRLRATSWRGLRADKTVVDLVPQPEGSP